LRSDRPYRKAWPPEKVYGYLQLRRGNQFDPQVVNKFLQIAAEFDGHSR
jgi:HD-GYP domain-containing protein (c-di-GMP phosphodiesterase class II)